MLFLCNWWFLFKSKPLKERNHMEPNIFSFYFRCEPCSYSSLPENDYKITTHQNTVQSTKKKKNIWCVHDCLLLQMLPKCLDRLWATRSLSQTWNRKIVTFVLPGSIWHSSFTQIEHYNYIIYHYITYITEWMFNVSEFHSVL